MKIISEIAEVIASLIDSIVIVFFLNRYFKVKYKNEILISAFGIIPLFIIAYYLSDYFGLQAILQIVITFVYAVTFLKGRKTQKVIINFAIIIIMAIISLVTIQLESLFTGVSAEKLTQVGSIQRIIVLVITKLLLIFVAYLCLDLANEYVKLKRDEWILIIIYFVSATIVSITLLNIVVNVNMNLLKQIQMISVTALLLAITSISFVLISKISKDKEFESVNKILNLQLEEQKSSLMKTQKMYDETRKLKHDINRHFTVFLDMLKNNEIDEVIHKIEEFVDSRSDNSIVYIENNSMINAILNEKVGICNSKKIPFELNISAAIEKEKELETAIMLSNVLDNAIEAELELSGEINIILEIFRHKGVYNVIVTNNIETSVLKTNPSLNTNKKNPREHGIGLLSVKDTIKKFEGNFDCYEKNNQFSVHIMIPN